MNLFRMRGAWDPVHAWLYDRFISRRIVPLYERLADEVAARLPAAGRVLDVGCGAGRATTLLARRRPGVEFTGVDLSPTMIRLARRNAAGVANASWRVADATALPFDDGAFDGAMSVASIKHWPDPARGLAEMARVVRPGGMVFVLEVDRDCSTPVATRFVARWWLMPQPVRPLAVRYFRRVVAGQGLDRDALRALVLQAGLADVEAGADPVDPVVYAAARKPPALAGR